MNPSLFRISCMFLFLYTNLIIACGIMAGIATDTVGGFFPNHKFLDSLANSPLTRQLKFVVW